MSALHDLLANEELMQKHDVDAEQVEFMIALDGQVKAWVATGGKDEKLQATIMKALDSWTYSRLPYAIKNFPFVTSHKLKAFNRNPYIANELYNKLTPSCKDNDKEYFQVGLAVDTYCTYGEKEFENRFLIKNRPDNITKEAAKAQNQVILTESVGEVVKTCVNEYKSRHFFPERLLKTNFIAVINGLACKAEVDDWRPEEFRFGDLKTNRNVNSFLTDSGWKNYLLQGKFYYVLIILFPMKELDEQQIEDFRRKLEGMLYVVDKYADFSRSHCFVFTNQTLNDGWGEINGLIDRWKNAVDSNIWEWTFDLDNTDDLKLFNDCELYPILQGFKDQISPTRI